MTPFRQPWGVQRQAADVEKTRFGKRIPSLNVDFGDPDGKITRVRVFELRAHCCGQIGFAIVIEEEVRVKAPSGVCVSDIFLFRGQRIEYLSNDCLLVYIYRITP